MSIFRTAHRLFRRTRRHEGVRTVVIALAGLTLGFAGLATAPAANASEAQATATLNVRTGPGTQYRVIDTLYRGEIVNMTECRPTGWCYVRHAGPDGWVSSRYLSATSTAGSPGPDCRIHLVISSEGPRFAIVCGTGIGPGPIIGAPYPPSRPPVRNARACFFTGNNYSGAQLCEGVGTYARLPAGFDNRISSVRLFNGARVRMCDGRNLNPLCRDFSTNVPSLGRALNNRVSSVWVYRGAIAPRRQACFYDRPGYNGSWFCQGVGILRTMPVRFNDRISSVRVFGGATVRLCSHTNMNGNCRTFSRDVSVLGAGLNNRVSSLRVR